MIAVLIARLPVNIGMEIAVQQMMGEEAEEVEQGLLPFSPAKVPRRLPEVHKNRPAASRMHQIPEM